MIYREFKGKKLSMLGFGAMRLPMLENGEVDAAQTRTMVEYSIEHGVNYFDTAYPYHNGDSERIIGDILKDYPRESFYLATKYPGHQISEKYDPAAVFEEQLKKCKVDYFDFYLLHNVYENSIPVYTDPQWGIIDYFVEQKRLGRIKHLGFSTHSGNEALEKFLDEYGKDMEFCQIQLNYLDWTLQQAKEKYEMLTKRGIPVWVMEPVRGGKLAKLGEAEEKMLKEKRPDDSIASWSLRFLQDLPNIAVILSGMSNTAQMIDNVRTFTEENPLSAEEKDMIFAIAEGMKNSVPCTACRYCCDGCPMELDIPKFLATYNEIRIAPSTNSIMYLDSMPEDKLPSACIKCGKCTQICPQNIDIPQELENFTQSLAKIPKWADICVQRAKLQR